MANSGRSIVCKADVQRIKSPVESVTEP